MKIPLALLTLVVVVFGSGQLPNVDEPPIDDTDTGPPSSDDERWYDTNFYKANYQSDTDKIRSDYDAYSYNQNMTQE